MSYPFVGPVEVPTPTADTHPSTKAYVDTGLAGKSATTHNHSGVYSPTAHNHDTTYSATTHDHDADYSATGHTHAHPLVPNPPLALTYAASLTVAAGEGNYRVVTATGNLTFNVPTGGTDGQMLRVRVIASTAQRTVSFHANLRRPTSIGTTLVIGSGKRGDIGLLYEAADGWTVLAAQAQA